MFDKETQRSFFPATERIVFAEQFGQLEPLRRKMVAMLADTGWSRPRLTRELGFTGNMAFHYFAEKTFQIPTAEHYARMQEITGGFPEPYENLRAEFDRLRRTFNVTPDHQYTDVWTFPTVNGYPSKHPCEKPAALVRHAIEVSHSPDLLPILDPFMGSGSTLRAAKDLGRKAIGIEIEERYCEIAAKRMGQEVLF